MTRPASLESQHAKALERVEAADARIARHEERIRALRAHGHSTVESERLLQLMRHSRAKMQEQADLLGGDKT